MAKSLPLPGIFRKTPTPYVGPDTKKSCPLRRRQEIIFTLGPETWQKENEKEHGKKVAHKPVKLNAGAGRMLDFLRVLVALHDAGYFTDEVGGQIDRKDVFAAFGEVMGLNLDRANISARG